MEYVNSQFDRSINWKDVEWLASQWDGPLVIKGIQTVGDARKSVESKLNAMSLPPGYSWSFGSRIRTSEWSLPWAIIV